MISTPTKRAWLLAVAAAQLAVHSPPGTAQGQPFIPPALERQMKKGSGLDQVWIGTAFDKAKGFSLGRTEYRAERREPGLTEYLPEALRTVTTQGSPYTLDVVVTRVTGRRSILIADIKGSIELEGKLTDQRGDIVAVFRVHGLMPVVVGGSNPMAGVDGIVARMLKDLR